MIKRKLLGQHFLNSKSIAELIVKEADFINPLGDALLLKKILKYDDKQSEQRTDCPIIL